MTTPAELAAALTREMDAGATIESVAARNGMLVPVVQALVNAHREKQRASSRLEPGRGSGVSDND